MEVEHPTATEDAVPALPSTVVMGWNAGPDSPVDAVSLLSMARADGYDFITVPATTTQPRSDMTLLESKWWRTSVVGVIPDISSNNSENPSSYDNIFTSALEWSLHMNLPALLVPTLPTQLSQVALYANALLTSIIQTSVRDLQIWIPVTMTDATDPSSVLQYLYRCLDYHPSIHTVLIFEPVPKPLPSSSSSYLLDLLRRLHLCIGSGIPPIAALQMPTHIFLLNKRGFPTLSRMHQTALSMLLRRLGRSIKLLVASSSEPSNVLSQLTPTQLGRTGVLPYFQYIQHLRSSKTEITAVLDQDPGAQMEKSYLDALQSPLQPLADHLEFYTYEIFEQDPVKYVQYRKAMHRAMADFSTAQSAAASKAPIPYIVLVVGAGRGPLVTACIQAYQQLLSEFTTGDPLHLYLFAVEKNPSALLYLQSKFDTVALREQTPGKIHLQIVASDLRFIKAGDLFAALPTSTAKANLIVSELLGSFGCNELSPECLDTLLYETDVCGPNTISIPSRYVSHITPIASMKLYQQVKQQALYPLSMDGTTQQVVGWLKAVETPYVVRPHAASQVYPPQNCWSFLHDPRHGRSNNASSSFSQHERYVHLEFSTPPGVSSLQKDTQGAMFGNGYGVLDDLIQSTGTAISDTMTNDDAATMNLPPTPSPWTCTGLMGTFTADLYGPEIQISTRPESFSRGMFSWFPLYFPAMHPMVVPAHGRVSVDVWRKCRRQKVWYEWAFTVWASSTDSSEIVYVSPIHNPGGRSSFVSVL